MVRLLERKVTKAGDIWYATKAVSVIVYVNIYFAGVFSLLPPPLPPGRAGSRPQAKFKKQYRTERSS